MTFQFSRRSVAALEGVHPDLVKVCYAALSISKYDFGIIEGLRSRARQAELVNAGKSQTMKSRHLTGKAVDFMVYVEGVGTFEVQYYEPVAEAFKSAAAAAGIKIAWGGDWQSFKDEDHIELDRTAYPDEPVLIASETTTKKET